MTGKQFLRISAISLGLLDAGSVLAQESPGLARQEKLPAQQAGQISETGQDAFRSRVQTRMRSMNQEERTLMNDLSVNGRQRMEAENVVQERRTGRDGGGEGSRFGRGYEARQMQQHPDASGSSPMNAAGAGPGMGARGGRGR